jgi:hypothetical protein
VGIILAYRDEMPVLLLDFNARGQVRVQFAFRTLDSNRVAFNLDRYSLRERDRLFSNS